MRLWKLLIVIIFLNAILYAKILKKELLVTWLDSASLTNLTECYEEYTNIINDTARLVWVPDDIKARYLMNIEDFSWAIQSNANYSTISNDLSLAPTLFDIELKRLRLNNDFSNWDQIIDGLFNTDGLENWKRKVVMENGNITYQKYSPEDISRLKNSYNKEAKKYKKKLKSIQKYVKKWIYSQDIFDKISTIYNFSLDHNPIWVYKLEWLRKAFQTALAVSEFESTNRDVITKIQINRVAKKVAIAKKVVSWEIQRWDLSKREQRQIKILNEQELIDFSNMSEQESIDFAKQNYQNFLEKRALNLMSQITEFLKLTTNKVSTQDKKAIKIEIWNWPTSVKYSIPNKHWMDKTPIGSDRMDEANDMAFNALNKEAKQLTTYMKENMILSSKVVVSKASLDKIMVALKGLEIEKQSLSEEKQRSLEKDKILSEKDKILALSNESIDILNKIKNFLEEGDFWKIHNEIKLFEKKLNILKSEIWDSEQLQVLEENLQNLKDTFS